jgi:hypothetical protein
MQVMVVCGAGKNENSPATTSELTGRRLIKASLRRPRTPIQFGFYIAVRGFTTRAAKRQHF